LLNSPLISLITIRIGERVKVWKEREFKGKLVSWSERGGDKEKHEVRLRGYQWESTVSQCEDVVIIIQIIKKKWTKMSEGRVQRGHVWIHWFQWLEWEAWSSSLGASL